jgi:hypothetical protein
MMDFNWRNLRAVGVTTGSLIALRCYGSVRVSDCVMVSDSECAGVIRGSYFTGRWTAGQRDSEFERLE